jgi:hypothetical protein
MNRKSKTYASRWATLSLCFSFWAMVCLFMGAVSSDYHWGWWPTLGFWIGCTLCGFGSLISICIATEGR